MAGHVLMRYLTQKGCDCTGIARKIYKSFGKEKIMDVADFQQLREFLAQNKFDYVVNAVGVLIGGSQSNFDLAITLNGRLPQMLQVWSKELNFKLVLISTDCVFDGKTGGYSVNDVPNAGDSYGLSKRIGEVWNDENTLTVRTSIIGPELKPGTGLWQWFESQEGMVSGYQNVFWSGVTTLELAKFIEFSMINGITGLKQLSNGKPISKYQLLKELQVAGINSSVNIEPNPIPKSNKTLIASKFQGYIVPDYSVMIAEQCDFNDF